MSSVVAGNKKQVTDLLDEAYACRTNNLTRSTELAEKALAISYAQEDVKLVAKSLSMLALFAMIKGEYDRATSMSEAAIKYFIELNDERGIADAKYNIAGIYYKTDNFHLGLVYLVDCLAIYRKFNDYHNQARVQKSLGTIYEYFGDQKKAVEAYESAIIAAKKAGDLNLKSNAYNPLSGIYLKQGKIEKAMEVIERSIAMKTETGDTRGIAFSIYGRGKVYAKLKEYQKAEDDFKETIRIHQEMGERLGLGMVYHKLSRLYVETGEFEKAKALLNIALEFGKEYKMVMVNFKCNYLLYKIYKQENDQLKALEYLEQYLEQKEAVINSQTLKVIENYEIINHMQTLEKEAELQREKAEIIEKKNRAEQSARVKQEFLSTMSHELRTPLNAVITIASLLSEKTDKEEQQLIDSLKFASNNLLLLINDILDFTKLEAGKAKLEPRPCNLTALLENIRKTYASLATEKGLELNLKIDKDIAAYYEIDETKLSQILINLVANAIKFTDCGKVDLTVNRTAIGLQTDVLSFKITDTGLGIAQKHQELIFDSFSQPNSITTRKQGGSGLGLAIVKKLVVLHGSTVNLKSLEGRGSVFYFDLEFKRASAPVKVAAKATDELKNKSILLAEDNLINAMLIGKVLSRWHITTDHAKNGLEAVQLSTKKAYDFILMDIHMPEMDGFEAVKVIRNSDQPNNKTPIFALTADVTAEFMDEHSHHFNGFLRKPLEIDKVYEALVNALYENTIA